MIRVWMKCGTNSLFTGLFFVFLLPIFHSQVYRFVFYVYTSQIYWCGNCLLSFLYLLKKVFVWYISCSWIIYWLIDLFICLFLQPLVYSLANSVIIFRYFATVCLLIYLLSTQWPPSLLNDVVCTKFIRAVLTCISLVLITIISPRPHRMEGNEQTNNKHATNKTHI